MGFFSGPARTQLYGSLKVGGAAIACPKCGDAGDIRRGFTISEGRKGAANITCSNRHTFQHPSVLSGMLKSLGAASGAFTIAIGNKTIEGSTTLAGAIPPSSKAPGGPGNRSLGKGGAGAAGAAGSALLGTLNATLGVAAAAVGAVGQVAGAAGDIAKSGAKVSGDAFGLARDGMKVGQTALEGQIAAGRDHRRSAEADAARAFKASEGDKARAERVEIRAARAAMPRRSSPKGSKPAPKRSL